MPLAAFKAIDALSRRRVGKIKERQAELIKEWGSDIIKDAVG
jgi:DNA-binding transcriptional regulator YbjK